MAIWQLDIQKNYGNEIWTNVYHGNVASQAEAKDLVEAVMYMERQIHTVGVLFEKYSVRPYPGPAEGTVYPANLFGTQPAGTILPLFNVVRVDFPAATGRPSRKYYRRPVTEEVSGSGELTTAEVARIQTVLDTFFATPDATPLCDVDGQTLDRAIVFPLIGMRQLRRGSRRRTTSIL